jgi:glycosyltransferase involved in cell wall biosynthesis
MKISVAIPTFNSSKFIQDTLASVLSQTMPPQEILVVDDGSTDGTVELVRSFGSSIRVIQQSNQGVAAARSVLSQNVNGDFVAFLDHDDIWHPRYLETQYRNYKAHPKAVAFITGHIDFIGHRDFKWPENAGTARCVTELMMPLDFLRRYNVETARFGSMSFISVPRRVLEQMGSEPFRISGVDDSYFCTVLPLLGSVLYDSEALVAYRITSQAQSEDRLRIAELWLKVFELLHERYSRKENSNLLRDFRLAYAKKRRRYARLLMGAGRTGEGRDQFWSSLRESRDAPSCIRSLAWILSTYLPQSVQPAWPESKRTPDLNVSARI